MKNRYLILFCLLVLLGATGRAAPRLHDLDVHVRLTRSGDAHITETRRMTIDDGGTECYIPIGNLAHGQGVASLSVSDETGLEYDNVGQWNVGWSRAEKSGRCGVVATRGGYELCWGLGASGERTYRTEYVVSNLVIGYPDADGFNWMFVAEGITPLPDHVRVTIVPEWGDGRFVESDSVKCWAFGCEGYLTKGDGAVVATTSEAFGSSSTMIIMVSMAKGVMEPVLCTLSETFDDVRKRAFEGSDYVDDPVETFFMWLFIVGFVLMLLLPVVVVVWRFVQRWRLRRQAQRKLTWWRDVPFDGNLYTSGRVLNALRYVGSDSENLLSAYVLRFVSNGALRIVDTTDSDGKPSQQIAIGVMPDATGGGQADDVAMQLYDIFRSAAGDDGVLQPHELELYMNSNIDSMHRFAQRLRQSASFDFCRHNMDGVRQVYGLRKFLKDFTLSAERHASEVGLWKEYLVYATLFGIADQVRRDMKQLNPEYFQLDKVADAMVGDSIVLPQLTNTTLRGTRDAVRLATESAARAHGSGGHISVHGGGGFHGGGMGGGVR